MNGMNMTQDEWMRFRKAMFDKLEKTGGLTLTWEQFKRVFVLAATVAVTKKDPDGPLSVIPQYQKHQSSCDCGQPFSTYKMRKDEFGEDFPACSRCGLRLQL